MVKDTLVGAGEIAEILGVTRQRVHSLSRTYADFPKPVAELAAGRVWRMEEIRDWMKAHPDRKGGRPRKS